MLPVLTFLIITLSIIIMLTLLILVLIAIIFIVLVAYELLALLFTSESLAASISIIHVAAVFALTLFGRDIGQLKIINCTIEVKQIGSHYITWIIRTNIYSISRHHRTGTHGLDLSQSIARWSSRSTHDRAV